MEGPQEIETTVKPQPEQAVEHKTGLSSKLIKIRANAREHTQEVALLFGVPTAEAEGQEPVGKIAPEDAPVRLEALAKEKAIPPQEFFSESRQALQASAQLKDKAIAEQKSLKEQQFSHQSNIGLKDERIRELDWAKGLRRIPAVFERRRLEGQRAGIQNQIDQLETQIQAKRQFVEQLSEQEKSVREKQEKALLAVLSEIGQKIQAIRSEYEQLQQEVFQDGTMLEEIRNAYIQQVITPKVDEIIKDRQLPEDKRDTFYTALRTNINHRDEPKTQRQPYRKELVSFYWAGFLGVEDYCERLLNGDDKEIVQRLVAKMAAEDIAPIKTAVESELRSWESRNKFHDIFEKAIEPIERWQQNINSFGNQILAEFDEYNTGRYPSMKFWQAVKSSNTANQFFGEFIQKQDQKIYLTALDKSLSDERGHDIGVLSYYRTPDAIRNLVIIAAADSQSYRTVNTNCVLATLSKQPDWGDILDEAENVYPALKTARPVLETWNWTDNNNHPKIQQAAADLALSILESKPTDSRLTDLTIETLPNSVILDILVKRGVIKEPEAAALEEAKDFLEKLPYDSDVERYSLQKTVRDNLFSLLREVREGRLAKVQLELTKRYAALSEAVLQNKTDYNNLRCLTSSLLVEVLSEEGSTAYSRLLDTTYFKKLQECGYEKEILWICAEAVARGELTPELSLTFAHHAPRLMDEKFKETRSFIFKNSELLIQNITDLRFLNSIVGEFGQKADFLIRGYQECLASGVIMTSEKELVLEFVRQFRVISPATIQGYKEAKQAGHEKVYIAQLRALAERMTGSGTVTDEERKRPYYKDLLRHVYANNVGQWSSFERNDSCADRSGDLAVFKIRPRYEIDLLSQSEIRVKAGESLNRSVQDEVQRSILEVAERMNALGHDKEKIRAALQANVDKTLEEILQKGGIQGVDLGSVTSIEEKMFLVLTDSIYGTRSVEPKRVKDLVITYEFVTFEDISDYIAGTRDRVGRANNQDYALLCEVGAFYSDRIKEVNRRLVQVAWSNPAIATTMPEYFKKLAQETTMTQRKDLINRLQIEKLGASESFVRQVGKILETRRGKKYEPDEIRRIIQRYESWTEGLPEKISTSPKSETRAFYGQLRSQRERTFEALRIIAGQEIDPKQVHLGEINLQQVLATEASIGEGKYDEEQFASYTVQRFIDLFEDERTKIDRELAKFISISGKQREVLYGYITKSKESANARMVGGVCVAGDRNMWDLPNYFQLVFQEPDTLQCRGLVLLHHFTEEGKRILTASVNPSSTYLYSVDEAALFKGIMGALEQFAQDNNFDMIAVSQNKTIRTNRLGGQFDKTMEARVTSVGKKFRFSSPQTFSYSPNYQLQDMDVVWERNK